MHEKFPDPDEYEMWKFELHEAFYDQSIFAAMERERIARDTKAMSAGTQAPSRRL